MANNTSAQPLKQPLNFKEIPEIPASLIDIFIRSVGLRIKYDLPSFGAVLIRQGCVLAKQHAVNLFDKIFDDTYDISTDDFDNSNIMMVHRDSLAKNAATVHLTTHGSALGAIMINPITYATDAEFTRDKPNMTFDIFENGELAGRHPTLALRSTIYQNDVLIFDDSQLHAFKPLTADRTAEATYFFKMQPE